MASALHPGRIGGLLLGPFGDVQTYRNLLYLLLSIPLGIVYWMVLGFGFVFGLVLAVLVVGLVILLGTLLGIRAIAGFERRLANRLLGLDLRAYDDVATPDRGGVLASVRPYVDAVSTWRAVGFVSLKTMLSVLALLGAFVLASAVSLLTAPLRVPATVEFGELNGEPVTWAIESVPEAALAGLLGLLLLVVLVHLANALAYVAGRISVSLLGESRTES